MNVEKKNQFGCVHIFYGFGPGKTSALFGKTVRALGHNLKPGIFQFMKRHSAENEEKGFNYGEYITMTEKLNVDVFQYGTTKFIDPKKELSEEDIALASKGIQDISDAIKQQKYDLIICDELLTAIHFKLVPVEKVVEIIKALPKSIELMISGHYEIPEIFELADYITEFKKIKHPFDKGLQGREGIEY